MTERLYQMTRIGKGDYLLPSNDARTLWRLRTYLEDGSAESGGRVLRGTFWGLWRWRGGIPAPHELVGGMDLGDWDHWEFWAGPLDTRGEAINEAMRARPA